MVSFEDLIFLGFMSQPSCSILRQAIYYVRSQWVVDANAMHVLYTYFQVVIQ